MKKLFEKVVMIAASLMLTAGLALAVEVKVDAPDASKAAKTAKTAGDKTKAAAADTKAGAKAAVTDTKAAAKGKIIDINSATEAELKAIPGVGDAYAAKIIAGRPYANKGQLKSRNVLPGPAYEKVKDLIIAKQVKK